MARARNLGVLSVSLVGDADQFFKTMDMAAKAVNLFNKRVIAAAKNSADAMKSAGISPKDITAAFNSQQVQAVESAITSLGTRVQELGEKLQLFTRSDAAALGSALKTIEAGGKKAGKSMKDLQFNTKTAFEAADKTIRRGTKFARDLFDPDKAGNISARAFERASKGGKFTVAEINKQFRAVVVDRKQINSQLAKVNDAYAILEEKRLAKLKEGLITEEEFNKQRADADKKRIAERGALRTALQRGELGGAVFTATDPRVGDRLGTEDTKRAQKAGTLFTEAAGQLVRLDEKVASLSGNLDRAQAQQEKRVRQLSEALQLVGLSADEADAAARKVENVGKAAGPAFGRANAAIAELATTGEKIQVIPDALQRTFDKLDRFVGRSAHQLTQLREAFQAATTLSPEQQATATKQLDALQQRLVQINERIGQVRQLPFGPGQTESQHQLGVLQEEARALKAEIAALNREHKNLTRTQKENFGSILRLSNIFRAAKGEGLTFSGVLRNLADEIDFTLGAIAGFAAARAILNTFLTTLNTAVTAFPRFQDEMKKVQAIVEATPKQLDVLSAAVLELSNNTIISAEEGAKALQILGQAGLSVGEQVAALEPLFAISIGGVASLEDSAQIATSILRAFRLEAAELDSVANTLVATVNKSKASIEDLNVAFNFAGSTAAGAHLEFNELAAVVGTLADNGVRASTQGTTFRRVVAAFIEPTKNARDVFQSLGIAIEDLNPLTHDLGEILLRLRDAGFSIDDAFRAFDERIAVSANLLVENADRYEELLKATTGTTAAFDAMDRRQESLIAQATILGNRIKNLAIVFGEGLALPLSTAIKLLNNLVSASNLASNAVTTLGAAMGAVVASGVIVSLAAGIGRLVQGLFALTPTGRIVTLAVAGIGLIATGMGALTRAFRQSRADVQDVIDRQERFSAQIGKTRDAVSRNVKIIEDALSKGETGSIKYASAQVHIHDELGKLILRAPQAADAIVEFLDALKTGQIDQIEGALGRLNAQLDSLAAKTAVAGLDKEIEDLESRRRQVDKLQRDRLLTNVFSSAASGGVGLPPSISDADADRKRLQIDDKLRVARARRAAALADQEFDAIVEAFHGKLLDDPRAAPDFDVAARRFAENLVAALGPAVEGRVSELGSVILDRAFNRPAALSESALSALNLDDKTLRVLKEAEARVRSLTRQVQRPPDAGSGADVTKFAAAQEKSNREWERTQRIVEQSGLPERAAQELAKILETTSKIASGFNVTDKAHQKLLDQFAQKLPESNSLAQAIALADEAAKTLKESGKASSQSAAVNLQRLAVGLRASQGVIDRLVTHADRKTTARVRNEEQDLLEARFATAREGLLRQAASASTVEEFEGRIAEIAQKRLQLELDIANTKLAEEAAIERAAVITKSQIILDKERADAVNDVAQLQDRIIRSLEAEQRSRAEVRNLELERQQILLDSGKLTDLFGGRGRAAVEADLEKRRITNEIANVQDKLLVQDAERARLIRLQASGKLEQRELASQQLNELNAAVQAEERRLDTLQLQLSVAREAGDVFINIGDSIQTAIADAFEALRGGGLEFKNILDGVWESFTEQGIAAMSQVLVEKLEFDKTFSANIFNLGKKSGKDLEQGLTEGVKAAEEIARKAQEDIDKLIPPDREGPPTREEDEKARGIADRAAEDQKALEPTRGAQVFQTLAGLITFAIALSASIKQVSDGAEELKDAAHGAEGSIKKIGLTIIAMATTIGASLGAGAFGIGAPLGGALGATIGGIIVKQMTKAVLGGIEAGTKKGLNQKQLENEVQKGLGLQGFLINLSPLGPIGQSVLKAIVPSIETIFDKLLVTAILQATGRVFNRQLSGGLGRSAGSGGGVRGGAADRAQAFFGKGGELRSDALALAKLMSALVGAGNLHGRTLRFFEILANNTAIFSRNMAEARDILFDITRGAFGGNFLEAFRFLESAFRTNANRTTGLFTRQVRLITDAFRSSFPTLDIDRVAEIFTRASLGRIGPKRAKEAKKGVGEASQSFLSSANFDVAFADFVSTLKEKIKESVIGGFVEAFVIQGPLGAALSGFFGQVQKLIKKAAKRGELSDPKVMEELLSLVNFQAVALSELLALNRAELQRMFELVKEVDKVIDDIITTPIQKEQQRLDLIKQTFNTILEAAQAVFDIIQRVADIRARLAQKIFAGTTGAEDVPQAPGITDIFKGAVDKINTEFSAFFDGLTPESAAGQEDSILALAESFENSVDAWLDATLTAIRDKFEPAIRLATQAAEALRGVKDTLNSILLGRDDITPSEKLASIDREIAAQRDLMARGTPEEQIKAAQELQQLFAKKLDVASELLDTNGPVYRALVQDVTGELEGLAEFLGDNFGDADELQRRMEEEIKGARAEAAGYYSYIEETIGPFLLSAEERAKTQLDRLVDKLKEILGIDENATLADVLEAIPGATSDALTQFLEQAGIIQAGGDPDQLPDSGGGSTVPDPGFGDEKVGKTLKSRVRRFFGNDDFTVPAEALRSALNAGVLSLFEGLNPAQRDKATIPLQGIIAALSKIVIPSPTTYEVVAQGITWLRNRIGELALPFLDSKLGFDDAFGKAIFDKLSTYIGLNPSDLVTTGQGLKDGGLVIGPTVRPLGEAGKEAVLPLEGPAMRYIADTLMQAMLNQLATVAMAQRANMLRGESAQQVVLQVMPGAIQTTVNGNDSDAIRQLPQRQVEELEALMRTGRLRYVIREIQRGTL